MLTVYQPPATPDYGYGAGSGAGALVPHGAFDAVYAGGSSEIVTKGWLRWSGRKRFVVVTRFGLEAYPDASRNIVDCPGGTALLSTDRLLWGDIVSCTHDTNPERPGVRLYRKDTSTAEASTSLSVNLHSYLHDTHHMITAIVDMVRMLPDASVAAGRVPVPLWSADEIAQVFNAKGSITKADIDEWVRGTPSGEQAIGENVPQNLAGIQYVKYHLQKIEFYKSLNRVKKLFEGEMETIDSAGLCKETLRQQPFPGRIFPFKWPDAGSVRLYQAAFIIANIGGELKMVRDLSSYNVADLGWRPGKEYEDNTIMFELANEKTQYIEPGVHSPLDDSPTLRWLVKRGDGSFSSYVQDPDAADQMARRYGHEWANRFGANWLLPSTARGLWFTLFQWWWNSTAGLSPGAQQQHGAAPPNMQIRQPAPHILPVQLPRDFWTVDVAAEVDTQNYGAWTPMRAVESNIAWEGTHTHRLTAVGMGTDGERRPYVIRKDSKIRLSATAHGGGEKPTWEHCEGFACHLYCVDWHDRPKELAWEVLFTNFKRSFESLNVQQKMALMPRPTTQPAVLPSRPSGLAIPAGSPMMPIHPGQPFSPLQPQQVVYQPQPQQGLAQIPQITAGPQSPIGYAQPMGVPQQQPQYMVAQQPQQQAYGQKMPMSPVPPGGNPMMSGAPLGLPPAQYLSQPSIPQVPSGNGVAPVQYLQAQQQAQPMRAASANALMAPSGYNGGHAAQPQPQYAQPQPMAGGGRVGYPQHSNSAPNAGQMWGVPPPPQQQRPAQRF